MSDFIDPTPCRNPRCETGDPVRTWLHPGYCGSACEWAHKVAMARNQPPIVHAAGVIPPEVEQAVTAQIDLRVFGQQIGGLIDGWIGVEPDPTPEPGWLKRRLTRWFG